MSPETAASLEALGEIEVAKLASIGEFGVPGSEHRQNVESWLHAKSLEASARREAREEDANSIARSAAATAERAARWAMYAAIVAVIAAAISINGKISSLISWFL